MQAATRSWLKGCAVAAASLAAGAVLASTVTAGAEDASPADPTAGTQDPAREQRPDERLLTGQVAEKVKDAALERYPGATVVRVETDSDGVYEAHLTRADGTSVTVEVDKAFQVTGEEATGRGDHGPHGGFGDRDGDDDLDGDQDTGTSADSA